MSVLVTGGHGFIGSNFLNTMTTRYPSIQFVNVDILHYCGSHRNTLDKPNLVHYKVDVSNQLRLLNILQTHEVTTLYHFAAKTHIDESFSDPATYVQANILGTFSLLEAVRSYGRLQKFVHVSTDEVYGENRLAGGEAFTESSRLNPTNPYSATKASAEILVKTWWWSFRVPVVIVRCNNVYGPRQYPEKLIPKFIQYLLAGKKCPVQGDGSRRRSFVYVDDVVDAYDLLGSRGVVGEVYNIGCDEEITVSEVTRRLVAMIRPGDSLGTWITVVPDRQYNDESYVISWSKLRLLGWKPTTSFEEGLKKTVEWFTTLEPNHWSTV